MGHIEQRRRLFRMMWPKRTHVFRSPAEDHARLRGTAAQRGFTLVELSIVLVIIGLLVGGVVKGRDIIHSTKVTITIQEMDVAVAAVVAFEERYGMNVRDDAANLFGDPAGLPSSQRSRRATVRLRQAGLLPLAEGAATITTDPHLHAFGGTVSFESGTILGFSTDFGTTSDDDIAVCFRGIPGTSGAWIDQRVDDGDATTGLVRATDAVAGDGAGTTGTLSAVAYGFVDSEGTVCMLATR